MGKMKKFKFLPMHLHQDLIIFKSHSKQYHLFQKLKKTSNSFKNKNQTLLLNSQCQINLNKLKNFNQII
jgi:hypothetical protein